MPKKDGTPTIRERMREGLEKRGFTYNGCTASPDFDFGFCCNRHDFDYQDLSKTKLQSDLDLAECMRRKSWKGALLAPFYFAAVSVAGHFYWKRKQNEAVTQALVPGAGPLGSDRL